MSIDPFKQFSPQLFTPGGNPNARSVASLGHIFAPVTKAVGGARDLLSSHVTYAAPSEDPRVAATLAGVGYNESRGVQGDPYAFSQPSGNKLYGSALGKYQVTEDLLSRLGPKYLGAKISSKDFLATPAIQESFMTARVKNLLEQGYTPQQIADIHRHGSTLQPGEHRYNRPEYVQGFEKGYDQYLAQNPQKTQTKK